MGLSTEKKIMAGFARVSITPPVGTRIFGFSSRNLYRGAEGIHDELYVRALYLKQGDEEALIIGFDLMMSNNLPFSAFIFIKCSINFLPSPSGMLAA